MIELQDQIINSSAKNDRPIPTAPAAKSVSQEARKSSIKDLRSFFKRIGMHPIHLVVPSLLALAATLFEGISVGLLIPTLKGLIDKDFSFARNFPVLKEVFSLFPESFIQNNLAVLCLIVVFIFSAAVLKNALQYLSSLSVAFQVTRLSSKLRKLVYERYLSFGKLYFDQHNSGHLHQILINYTQQVARRINVLHSALFQFFTLFVYLFIMVAVSWQLTLFASMLIPTLYLSLKWVIDKMKHTSKSYTDSCSMLGSKIANVLTCIPLVKAYTNEKKEKESFAETNDLVEMHEFSISKKELLMSPLQEVIILLLFLALIGAMAFLLMKHQTGDIAAFLVFLIVLKRCMWSFSFVNQIKISFAAARGPILEIMSVLDDNDKYFVPEGKKEFNGLKNAMEFCGLSFVYPRGVQALQDVSFRIEKGKMTAIVGSSGSGKTTLVNLIMRFYDCASGTLKLDGVDIRDFSVASLRSRIALVSQDPLLVNETLRFNLTYGMSGKTLSDEKIIDALQRARLYDFVKNLPLGLDTQIGDRGIQLSGGEKQRVAIGRAMLHNPEILLLDEATSALDTRTEQLIQEAIDELIKDKTSVIVAHRLSTIQNADKIVVIENGCLVEEGALSDLLASKNKFYEYWEAQKFY